MSSVGYEMDGQLARRNEPSAFFPKFDLGMLFRGFPLIRQSSRTSNDAIVPSARADARVGRRHVRCNGKLDNKNTDIPALWMDRAWRTVSGVVSQTWFPRQLPAKRKFDAEKNVPRRRLRPRAKLREMSPLENHLLLLMSNQSPVKHYRSLEKDTGESLCNFCDTIGAAGTFGHASEMRAFSVGIFLQTYPVGKSKLAHILSKGNKKLGHRNQSILGFARLQGEPQMLCTTSLDPEIHTEGLQTQENQFSGKRQLVPFVLLRGVNLMALMELIPQVQGVQQQQAFPDKRELSSVQDFFLYTEKEGRRVFQELDRDKDGQITLDDLKVAMHKMKLPSFYAQRFLRSTNTLWLAKSFGWSEFSSLMQEKEPIMIRLFNSIGVTKSGTLQITHVNDLLRNAGLPATEANAMAMMSFLGVDTDGSVKYGQFRKFMLLIPTEHLLLDPWSVWFKAATSRPETSKKDFPYAALKSANLFSRRLVHQLEAAKAMAGVPHMGSVGDVSNFIRPGVKQKVFEPATRLGADVLVLGRTLLNNAVAEVSEIQPFRSLSSNVIGSLRKHHYQNEEVNCSSFYENKYSAAQQSCLAGLTHEAAEEPSCESR